ncbi:uncharacterized protein LOC127256110 isoform X2 [Andrographis paniculata]|uniref:uncharacterized protein LOC127256110 isoform X2 n=1 Tax=Andrographis paniculata TaxID=175694 RepID=UPI0021E73C8A|nr:uncharacterized protein LOC127256110 isoform X2 [Andrographis paniculata]
MGCEHPEWLPAGWKVKVKARSYGKKDRYYVNPDNSLKFSSKLEVLRYLESSVKDDNADSLEKSCAEAEGQMSISDNVDESLLRDKIGKSGSKKSLLKTGERRRSLRLAANKLKDHAVEDSSSSQTGAVKNSVAATATITVPETTNRPNPTESAVEGQRDSSLSTSKSRGSKRKSASDLPRRTSKRLAGVKIEIESDLKPAKATRKSMAPEIDTEGQTDDRRNPDDNQLSLPSIDGGGKNIDEKQRLDALLQQFLMDPCIAFAFKLLTGEIPVEELTGADYRRSLGVSPTSSLASPNQASASTAPSANIWGDPSVEFAVKTLTGNAPTSSQPEISLRRGDGRSSATSRVDNIYPSKCSFTRGDAVKTQSPGVGDKGQRKDL